jgi:hypothetical protein
VRSAAPDIKIPYKVRTVMLLARARSLVETQILGEFQVVHEAGQGRK